MQVTALSLLEDTLRTNYSYDADTGLLTRLVTGRTVGSINTNGYLKMCCRSHTWQVHRVCWFLHYGSWPVHHIDHINRNPLDNRIDNLRDVTIKQNNQNRGKFGTGHRSASRRKAEALKYLHKELDARITCETISHQHGTSSTGAGYGRLYRVSCGPRTSTIRIWWYTQKS